METPSKLSPENYLRYFHLAPSTDEGGSKRTTDSEFKLAMNQVFLRIDYATTPDFLSVLRAAWLRERFDVPENPRPENGDDILSIKYCKPVSEVTNRVIFNSTEIPRLKSIRVINEKYPTYYFISSNREIQAISLTSAGRSRQKWHPHRIVDLREKPQEDYPDWSVQSKCFGIVKFMTPETCLRDNLRFLRGKDAEYIGQVRAKREDVLAAFGELMSEIQETKASFGIITDEKTSFVVEQTRDYLNVANSQGTVILYPILSPAVSISRVPITLMLARYIYEEANEWSLARHPLFPPKDIPAYLESHPDPDSLKQLERSISHTYLLSDFHPETLKVSRELQEVFTKWRTNIPTDLAPPRNGDAIKLELSVFTNTKHSAKLGSPLRSSYPSQLLPGETTQSPCINREKRPINGTLVELLQNSSSTNISFHVEGAISRNETPSQLETEEVNCSSQIIFGRVDGCEEILCLKLYDERYFDIPEPDPKNWPPLKYGLSMFSEDMVRREKSIYDSLSEYQGTLLPYCYGFHMCEMSDGWKCFGLLMEKIDGESLLATLKAHGGPEALPTTSSTNGNLSSLISQLRHGVRILRSKCITQRWLFNQIICQKDPMVHIVFVDFAFATMLYKYKPGMDMPVAEDLDLIEGLLRMMLHEDLVQKHWLPPLDYEL